MAPNVSSTLPAGVVGETAPVQLDTHQMVDGVALEVYCFNMGLLKGWPIHQMEGGQQCLGYKKTSIILSQPGWF